MVVLMFISCRSILFFCSNEHKTYKRMIFTGGTFSAIAANASLNTANALLRSRRHDDEKDYYEEEPIATTQQRKTNKIKIKGSKKD